MIIILGVFLRFSNITDRGLFYSDEALYANGAKTPAYALNWILNRGSIEVGLQDYLKEHFCNAFPEVKPGHVFLSSFGFMLLGIHDYSILVVSAFFGSLTLILVYVLGNRFFNKKVALIATTILAVSGTHIVFSRSGYGQSSAAFFSLLGTYLFLLSLTVKERDLVWLFLSALCLGLAFTMHPLVNLIILSIYIVEFISWFFKRVPTKLKVKRGLILIINPLTLLVMIEAYFRLGNLLTGATGMTYLDWLFSRIGSVSETYSLTFDYLFFIPKTIWGLEGQVAALFLVIGLSVVIQKLIKNFSIEHLLILIQFLLPAIYWSFNTGTHPTIKILPIILPAMALIAAIGSVWLSDKVTNILGGGQRFSTALMIFFCLAIIGSGLVKAKGLVEFKTSYKEAALKAADYLEANGGIMTKNQQNLAQMWGFYLGWLKLNTAESVRSSIDLVSGEKGDYAVIDFRQFGDEERFLRYALKVEEEREPVLRVKNDGYTILPPILVWMRGGTRIERGVIEPLKKYPAVKDIRIYDLRVPKKRL